MKVKSTKKNEIYIDLLYGILPYKGVIYTQPGRLGIGTYQNMSVTSLWAIQMLDWKQ